MNRNPWMMLEWQPFTPQNRPPKVTCFFSDGVCTYWAGWFTSDDGVGIAVPCGDGTNELLTPQQFASVKFWAHPGNFIANTQHVPEDYHEGRPS